MSDVAIKVEDLSKKYILGAGKSGALMETVKNNLKRLTDKQASKPREFLALHDINFEIKHGEAVGIIGKNGAGKSTLLKLLSRITYPTTGKITINGRVASLLEVGTGFHPDLSGGENIYLSGAMLGMTRREIKSKFDEIVAFSGTEQFLSTPVKRYSSGMYMRLAFAVAAHLDPEILIVDEVLAVGDVDFQKKCVKKMSEVSSRAGSTILFVSHNMVAVNSLCQTSIMLDHGTLIKQGATPDIIDLYINYNNAGNGDTFVVKHLTEWLTFNGLRNKDSLMKMSIKDDLYLELVFTTGPYLLRGCNFDLSLVNERGETVIQSMSKYVAELVDLEPHTEYVMKYAIERPNLAPGDYFVNVNVHSVSEQMLWIENIPACRVNANSYFGIVDYYDTINSATFPRYEMVLESRQVEPAAR